MEHKATTRKYGDSIRWLRDANMVYLCPNTNNPILPLKAYEKENEFKVYFNDTGLLMALYGFSTKQALLRGTLTGFAKGGIYENLIAVMLTEKDYRTCYYKPDESTEIEFLLEKDGEVIPVEVKAGNNASKSLNSFLDKFSPTIAYKIIGGNLGMTEKKLSLPHYMAMFL